MNMLNFWILFILVLLLCLVFYILGYKEKFNNQNMSTFECGFNSYFFSRFSFSIHYFSVALIFLFLDLELSFLMPIFNELLMSFKMNILSFIFVSVLVMGLLVEWMGSKLEWYF